MGLHTFDTQYSNIVQDMCNEYIGRLILRINMDKFENRIESSTIIIEHPSSLLQLIEVIAIKLLATVGKY